jgi:hypothetical protein
MHETLKLITTWTPFEYSAETIRESKEKNNGKIVMKGVLQKAETLNQNGRVYPLPILEREVRNYQKFIRENRALGECDHPDSSVVELKNVSHIVREAHLDGDTVYGTVELLDTPCGQILQNLISAGVTLGISSRGVGSTRKDGDLDVVQDDFQLICWDFVSEPSTPGAFMMREGRNVTRRELNEYFTKSDRVDRVCNEIVGWQE